MRSFELTIAIIWMIAGAMIANKGVNIYAATSIHEIYQTMYYGGALLCFGFGSIMFKATIKEDDNEQV